MNLSTDPLYSKWIKELRSLALKALRYQERRLPERGTIRSLRRKLAELNQKILQVENAWNTATRHRDALTVRNHPELFAERRAQLAAEAAALGTKHNGLTEERHKLEEQLRELIQSKLGIFILHNEPIEEPVHLEQLGRSASAAVEEALRRSAPVEDLRRTLREIGDTLHATGEQKRETEGLLSQLEANLPSCAKADANLLQQEITRSKAKIMSLGLKIRNLTAQKQRQMTRLERLENEVAAPHKAVLAELTELTRAVRANLEWQAVCDLAAWGDDQRRIHTGG